MFVESLRRPLEAVVAVVVVVELLKGRVGGRLESLESGEGPCALVLAQERMRSIYDGVLVEAFFIDVETRERWSCPWGLMRKRCQQARGRELEIEERCQAKDGASGLPAWGSELLLLGGSGCCNWPCLEPSFR
jgi:hypothetical protein